MKRVHWLGAWLPVHHALTVCWLLRDSKGIDLRNMPVLQKVAMWILPPITCMVVAIAFGLAYNTQVLLLVSQDDRDWCLVTCVVFVHWYLWCIQLWAGRACICGLVHR